MRDQAGHRRQQHLQLGHRVEDRFLVLLQVAVVGQRLRLQRGQQAGQVADQPARLAAGQLGDVGVLLLRHDRAAGRPCVVQRRVAEFGGAPEDDVLGQPGQVDADHRQHERRLGGEVPRRGGIDGVVRGGVESQFLGDRIGVEAERRSRQRPGSVRRHRGALVEVDEPVDVTQQRVRVGEQVVGQQDRLRRLQMGLARQDRGGMRGGLGGQRRHDLEHAVGDPADRVAQPHPKQRGHLVISRTACAQPAAEFGADAVDQSTLQRAVHVLVADQRAEAAVGDVGAQAVQPGEQPVALLLGEQTRAANSTRAWALDAATS